MTPPLLGQILTETLVHMPYNSVTVFHKCFGSKVPDPRFGNACVWQAAAVADALRAQGVEDVRLLNDGRHLAAVGRCGEVTYLFDPYLLHMEPINLTGLMESGGTADYTAYPICCDDQGKKRPGSLQVKWHPRHGQVELRYRQFVPRLNRYRPLHRFRLPLNKPSAKLPTIAQIRERFTGFLFHGEQTTLSIRILDPTRQSLSQLVYPVCDHHGDSSVTPDKLFISTSNGLCARFGTQDFSAELTRMAACVGCADNELIEFVLGGVVLYEQHAPQKIDYRSKSPVYQPSKPKLSRLAAA